MKALCNLKAVRRNCMKLSRNVSNTVTDITDAIAVTLRHLTLVHIIQTRRVKCDLPIARLSSGTYIFSNRSLRILPVKRVNRSIFYALTNSFALDFIRYVLHGLRISFFLFRYDAPTGWKVSATKNIGIFNWMSIFQMANLQGRKTSDLFYINISIFFQTWFFFFYLWWIWKI